MKQEEKEKSEVQMADDKKEKKKSLLSFYSKSASYKNV